MTEYSSEDLAWHTDVQSRGGINVSRFEIFYGDGIVVLGTTVDDWIDAPNDDVQIVIWERNDQSIEMVWGMDDYNWGTSWKTGKWMIGADFRELKKNVFNVSKIYNRS